MKKNYFIFVVAIAALLSSCASTYHYCQVYETKPVKQDNHYKKANGDFCYENEHCIIDYNFWANGGSADFSLYNKTDEIIYVDLAKSFYVMNGEAYDLYRSREWTESSSIGFASSYAYSNGATRAKSLSVGLIEPSLWTDGVVGAKASKAASRSASVTSGNTVAHTESSAVTFREKKEVAIPPHSKKYIKSYNIVNSPMLNCDLQRYPSRSARLNFSSENSPYKFSDYITYSVGDNAKPISINNEFYVSSVTNYPEPDVVEMRKREEPCDNVKDPDYTAPQYDLYDKVIRDSICETSTSFYDTYSKTTTKKLYDKYATTEYSYDKYYKAYVKSKVGTGKAGKGSSGSFVAFSIVTGVIALLIVIGLLSH